MLVYFDYRYFLIQSCTYRRYMQVSQIGNLILRLFRLKFFLMMGPLYQVYELFIKPSELLLIWQETLYVEK